jgi:hypothetical protein
MSTKTFELTKTLTDKAERMGRQKARAEFTLFTRAVGPAEDLWEDEIPEDVFQSVTGYKAADAEFWQVQEVADQYENGYYDEWIEIMSGDSK